ncbi:MAG: glucose-6-phosphate isomerase [Opitutaceae bacterium]|nr:glucose-6-phosphate isomerase [Opitutaceae bacterium]
MSWSRFTSLSFHDERLGFTLDLSRMNFDVEALAILEPKFQQAFDDMAMLEQGSVANPDEQRMVGHYWLRSPALAPTPEIKTAISDSLIRIEDFAGRVHRGEITGPKGPFKHVLVIGIGGSALGPQFVREALGQPQADKLTVWFFDNTDPDGMDNVLASLAGKLPETLALVISKSGGTVETRNGMLEAAAAFKAAGLQYPQHFVAVTGEGSKLDHVAQGEGWLARFPMWDWVGGRTSVLGPVGLLPAALQGLDIGEMLNGAAAMDQLTRRQELRENPAALLAAAWFLATKGAGEKDMVILPYKDRLLLFSRYLQQLIMESIGKELDLAHRVVNQGIAVYGNKGSSDQHAYVQQLREGVNNFFVTFIEVLRDRAGDSLIVEDGGITSGDYLQGFYLGTRDALTEKNRESLTITVPDVSPRTIGCLIALYERAVGLYATLININAYHQPGVEAGKKAAGVVITLKKKITVALANDPGTAFNAEALAARLGADPEPVFKILSHLAANPQSGVTRQRGAAWHRATFTKS